MTKQIENLIAQAALAMKTDGITNPTEEQCKAYFLGRIERERYLLRNLKHELCFTAVDTDTPRHILREKLATDTYNEIRSAGVCGVKLCENPATCEHEKLAGMGA